MKEPTVIQGYTIIERFPVGERFSLLISIAENNNAWSAAMYLARSSPTIFRIECSKRWYRRRNKQRINMSLKDERVCGIMHSGKCVYAIHSVAIMRS